MTQVLVILLALLIGVIAGLRALTAPAVVAWGAFLGWIDVDGKWSEWVAHPITVTVLTIFLLIELVTDQLPKTPSRKTAPQFLTRLIMGAFAGAVIGSAFFHTFSATGAGIIGAVLGTLGGAAARQRLSAANDGKDRPVPSWRTSSPSAAGSWSRSSSALSSEPRSMAEKFDAIIVGAGQAGPPLAGRLTEAGQTVAVIERKLVGGTCVNYGCIPTKTLVASAHAAHLARRGADYGIGTGDITVDMAKVKARKDKVSGDDRRGLESWLEGMKGCTFIRGHARFESPHTIRVDDRLLEADKIFLNVGGRAVAPDMPGLADIDYMTNVGILELDTVPEHLVIIGGSYIALEFAQMYRRFGARVTVIEKGPAADPARGRGRLRHDQGDPGGRRHRCGGRRHRDSIHQARQRIPSCAGRGCRADRRHPSADGGGPSAQHRRPRAGQGRCRDRRPRLHRRRRPAAHQRRAHLGDGRLQRPRRVHPHVVQRFRDRRGEPARRRAAEGQRPHPHLCAVHRPAARPRRHDRRRGPQVRPKGFGGQAPDDPGRAGGGKG